MDYCTQPTFPPHCPGSPSLARISVNDRRRGSIFLNNLEPFSKAEFQCFVPPLADLFISSVRRKGDNSVHSIALSSILKVLSHGFTKWGGGKLVWTNFYLKLPLWNLA